MSKASEMSENGNQVATSREEIMNDLGEENFSEMHGTEIGLQGVNRGIERERKGWRLE